MTDWIALSDRIEAGRAPPEALVEVGIFVLEFTLPLRAGAVLVDFQADDGWPRTFSIFADPEAGVMILHRQGEAVVRHVLPGPLPTAHGPARLSLRFDAPRRTWAMNLDLLGSEQTLHTGGDNPLPLRLDDLRQLCVGQRLAGKPGAARHPAVLWFGATTGAALPDRAPWIGLGSRVDTLRGPVAAGSLRPGDQVMTLDDGPVPVLRVTRRDLPSCGFFAPVLLRAPFFGLTQDLLVSADQRVALSGTLVEYHFGEDEVLVAAGSLIDGCRALAERRRSVTASVALDLGCPALFTADGCVLMSDGGDLLTPPPRRVLEPFEVRPLLSQAARSVMRIVA